VITTGDMDLAAAIAHGTLVDKGTKEITDHGFCWDTLGEPTLAHENERLGGLSTATSFQATLTTLKPEKVYHLRAFVLFGEEALYGSTITFTTPALPELTTSTVTEITETYAKSGGEITADNGSPVLARGVCWGTGEQPDTTGSHTLDGSGTGVFVSVLAGLSPNTTYFVRAYAKSIYGIRYAHVLTFSTGQSATAPFVSTTVATNIGQTTAASGGNVVADGGAPVTLRGVCWSTNPYPTTADHKTENGTGTGVFVSYLVGLNPNTTYYIRAYATNEVGTAYGNQVSFTTLQAPDMPAVTTTPLSNITQTSATTGGTVTADGGSAVTVRGVCWSTNPNPTTAGAHTTDGTGLGSFVSTLESLSPNTTYYIRAYATNSAGTAYGNEISFTTGQTTTTPSVTTAELSGISQTTATSGGEVTNDGGATVTARGVCWSTTANPTLTNSHTTNGSGTGTFGSSITGLTANTTYYVRAYATNSAGTSYGNERTFTTLPNVTTPSVTTAPVTGITPSSAQSGGTVTASGGASVTSRGVCWSTQQNPDLGDSYTSDGSGTGSYTSSMTGLTPNTFYYVRAYATNSAGTAYGSQLTFMTTVDPVLPTVTTADAMNVSQTEATTGGTVHTDGGATVTARGVCYSTSSGPTLANSFTTNGSGLGTFVSSLTGLTPGTQYYVRAYATNSVGTAYGNEITFTTLTTITLPTVTTDAITNITQTTATGGGNVTSGGGGTVTARGVCWSTSPNPTLSNSFTNNGSGTGSFVSNLTGLTANTLYYVRAYATNSVGTAYGNEVTFTTLANPVIPTVTTTTVTNITQTTATSGGNVTADGGATVTARGVCWNTSSNPTLSNSYTTDGSGTGSYVSNLTGLTANTLYYVRAYATNSVGTAYGNELTFTTLASPWQCGDQITYSGQVYNTVLIGTQCWMKENLNVGTMISGSQDQTNNGIIEKYCYENNPANCNEYGGLYQWDEMMQYVTTPGVQGICPNGWHVPTDGEWTTLSNYLGGESVAGGKMKEAGYSHWAYPNTGATNSSGFTGLPSGWKVYGISFVDLTFRNMIWTSNQYSTGISWNVKILYNYASTSKEYNYNTLGFSVRCTKN